MHKGVSALVRRCVGETVAAHISRYDRHTMPQKIVALASGNTDLTRNCQRQLSKMAREQRGTARHGACSNEFQGRTLGMEGVWCQEISAFTVTSALASKRCARRLPKTLIAGASWVARGSAASQSGPIFRG
jgi:hypothetical protein